MTDKQIIIDGYNLEYIKELLYNGQRSAISTKTFEAIIEELKRKEQECEELKEGYSELTDIVSPYMDDFTGYNEELGGFDIVLCVKELMEQLDQLKAENDELKKNYFTVIQQRNKAEQTLTEIKEIATENSLAQVGYNPDWDLILQKISECEGNDE